MSQKYCYKEKSEEINTDSAIEAAETEFQKDGVLLDAQNSLSELRQKYGIK